MGLDMYLHASQYVSAYPHAGENEKRKYKGLLSTFGIEGAVDPGTPAATIEFTVAYWRKANQIHNWFVENVQGGEDDCGTYDVTRDQLRELRDTAKKVLDSLDLKPGKVANGYKINEDGKREYYYEDGEVATNIELAKELLPATEGFFFGSTDYDGFYARDLEDTITQIDRVLKALPDGWYLAYHSSW